MTVMLPPLPPSPPEGPPYGTPSSRRNAAEPFPPSPALTSMIASSMNCMTGDFCEPGAGIYQAVTWLAVWMRAVIRPAGRRALPVWIGTGIVGGTIFGGTGMHPHDLTTLALGSPVIALGLAATWLLLFVPVARVVVRDDATRFLRSLPHAPWPPRLLGLGALLWYQLPWLALWLLGEHVLGLALAIAFTPIICAMALWRGRPPHAGD